MKSKTLLGLGLALVPLLISAQDLGHEYKFDAAPIREGEKAVIPLDTKDPSYNLFRQLRDLSGDRSGNQVAESYQFTRS